MADGLLPCPFCGGEDPEFEFYAGKYGWFVYVVCSTCGARTRPRKAASPSDEITERDSEKAWNTRRKGM
jgi:Lar family restriction alleviation protein